VSSRRTTDPCRGQLLTAKSSSGWPRRFARTCHRSHSITWRCSCCSEWATTDSHPRSMARLRRYRRCGMRPLIGPGGAARILLRPGPCFGCRRWIYADTAWPASAPAISAGPTSAARRANSRFQRRLRRRTTTSARPKNPHAAALAAGCNRDYEESSLPLTTDRPSLSSRRMGLSKSVSVPGRNDRQTGQRQL
jgi:hypothetical protein